MNLIYYYSNGCLSCKDYEEVVNRLSENLKINNDKVNINETQIKHKIEGVPTIILEKDGIEIYRSVGNLAYEYVLEGIMEVIGNDE